MKLLPIHGNFLTFSPTSSHLYSLQVENCDSNSRLVVDKDDNGKHRLERVKVLKYFYTDHIAEDYPSKHNAFSQCCFNILYTLRIRIMRLFIAHAYKIGR